MSEVGIRALKQNASKVVGDAAAGETITITDRGRPVAQIVPLAGSWLQTLIAVGLATPPRRSLTELSAPTAGPNLSAALADLRSDER